MKKILAVLLAGMMAVTAFAGCGGGQKTESSGSGSESGDSTKVEVKDIKTEKYKYKEISDDNAFVVNVNLEYKQDLGYPKTVEVKLLHFDKKLEIYKMK